ncbi:MAG: ATP-binding protein [Acinetobacter sp.]
MIERPLYINQIRPLINKDIVKVLVGFRRAGKSILLNLIKDELLKTGVSQEQFISINFEDFSFYELREAKKLHDYLKEQISAKRTNFPNEKIYLFLDEIQEVTGFEQVINSIRVSENVDIYITGSNANLLSGELATYLAGRYIQIFVYPFGFQEYVTAYQQKNKSFSIAELFSKYLVEGGMPFLVSEQLPDYTQESYLKDIYNSVILKDIIERNKIRDIELLERTVEYAFQNVGQIFSAHSISKYLKSQNRATKSDTLLNYIQFCRNALLLYPLKRHDLKGKKVFQTNDKYYVIDHGLRQAMLHKNQRDIQQILENIVAIEGLRRGYIATVGYVGDYEIDFVFEKGNSRLYVQVSYLLSTPETAEREFRSLLAITDNYRKIVVSMDPILQPRDGIEHKTIADFLLEDEW